MAEGIRTADHSAFGALGLELVYGEQPNGELVHVSAVKSGLACSCVCPACGARLVARKGPKTAHHFGHHAAGSSCGFGAETNAHIWAKQVLERTRRIKLPAIEAEIDHRVLTRRPAKEFAFDQVRLESRMGDMVPDVVLTAQGRELIVEVFVTHRCDQEKLDKLRTAGVSAIEVDLSRYRRCDDAQAVTQALLQDAPRVWLFNPLMDATERELRSVLDAEQAAAAKRLEHRAKRLVLQARSAVPMLSDRLRRERDWVVALGRRDLINLPCPESDGFIVPPSMWQAAIFARFVLRTRDHVFGYNAPFHLLGVYDGLSDCLALPFRQRLGHELLEAVSVAAPDFILPTVAIRSYLEHLVRAGVLTEDGYGGLRVAEGERRRLHQRSSQLRAQRDRRVQGLKRVQAVLGRLPAEETQGFSLKEWRRLTLTAVGCTFDQATETGEEVWSRFDRALTAIEAMQRGGAPAVVTLALPLTFETARRQEVLRVEAEDRRRRAEEVAQKAADARVWVLRSAAERVLGSEAEAWRQHPGRSGGLSPEEATRLSDEGLHAAQAALELIVERRAERRAAEAEASRCREELRSAAARSFSERHAEVFLNSAHPALDGAAPETYCQDKPSLRDCLRLLPSKPKRRWF